MKLTNQQKEMATRFLVCLDQSRVERGAAILKARGTSPGEVDYVPEDTDDLERDLTHDQVCGFDPGDQ